MHNILILLTLLMSHGESLDDLITEASKRHGLNEINMRAIAYIESSYGLKINSRTNSNGTKDHGVFQINSIHLKNRCKDLDVKKLRGNVECAARLIKMHKKYKSQDEMWLARYHSKTPKYKKIYYKKLKKAKVLLLASDK